MVCVDILAPPACPRSTRVRCGVTLIELLVSVALTLIVILAIVRVFDLLGSNVSESRAILELSAQLRSAATQLQTDLDRLTVKPKPPLRTGSAEGYLEIVEGFRRDFDNDGDGLDNIPDPTTPSTVPGIMLDDADPFLVAPTTSVRANSDLRLADRPELWVSDPLFLEQANGLLGETDDMIMGTIRSTGEPFRGRLNNLVIESPLAEVIYWVLPIPGPSGTAELAVVRRVMLILPTNQVQALLANEPNHIRLNDAGSDVQRALALRQFLQFNDLSVRPEVLPGGAGIGLVANRLADLRFRRNRFAHWPDALMSAYNTADPRISRAQTFPDLVNPTYLVPPDGLTGLFAQDVMAMDVRVYDPLAPVYRPTATTPFVVTPTDAGYDNVVQTGSAILESYGAYVDLGYNWNDLPPIGPKFAFTSHFSNAPHPNSGLLLGVPGYAPRVYDTWTVDYERDGVNQNGPPGDFATFNQSDTGSDGFDNNNNFVVDDLAEQETQPPYAHPLRGMEVILRLRDVSSQQIRQASVVADFVSP